MIIYGTHRCPDCENAERLLNAKGITYDYVIYPRNERVFETAGPPRGV